MNKAKNSKPPSIHTHRMLDPDFQNKIRSLYDEGISLREISRRLKVARSTVREWLKAQGLDSSYNRVKAKRVSCMENSSGYRFIYMPQHGNANAHGYVREHVLIASKALGRPLKTDEVVHHINGDKLDNRNCNLLICSNSYHQFLHRKMGELYQKEHFPRLT
jgi:IS30 family transposase